MTTNGPARDHISGILLAGGRSSRMFSDLETPADKGLLEFAGTPMLAIVAASFKPQVTQLVLNANGDPARFAHFGLPVAADTLPGYAGPLAGMLAGMRWSLTHTPEATHIATAPVDCPLIPKDFVTRLSAGLGSHDIALAASRGRTHPVIGLWPVTMADDLEAALKSGTRAMMAWVKRHDAVTIEFPDLELGPENVDPFFNVNTPEDLAYARALLTIRPPVIAIAGWKNSGKTTLACALIEEFTRRGVRVAAIKHTHHDFSPHSPGTDSDRHRHAGARQVAVVGPNCWYISNQLHGEREPTLDEVQDMLSPADLVIIEGYKNHPIPKIEVRASSSNDQTHLAPSDPHVLAIASDEPQPGETLPVFPRDRIGSLATFIAEKLGLQRF